MKKTTIVLIAAPSVIFLIFGLQIFRLVKDADKAGEEIQANVTSATPVSILIDHYKSKFGHLPSIEMTPSQILTEFGKNIGISQKVKVTDRWNREFKIFYANDSYLVVSAGPNGVFDFANGDDVFVNFKR